MTKSRTADARLHASAKGGSRPTAGRVTTFKIFAGLTGVFFLYLSVSNMIAPWGGAASNPDDTQPGMHRWFTAVSGATDLIGAVCLVALALRPRGRELLALNVALGCAIAAVIVTPFTPGFLLLLLVFVPVLATYPYRRGLAPRTLLHGQPPRVLLVVAVPAAAALLIRTGLALSAQLEGADSAAQFGYWADYAEHCAVLALSSLLAITPGHGWRILRSSCGMAWLYLGLVATAILPAEQGSWGHLGGLAALGVGVVYVAASVHDRKDPNTSQQDKLTCEQQR
jgi:hypothetical protein